MYATIDEHGNAVTVTRRPHPGCIKLHDNDPRLMAALREPAKMHVDKMAGHCRVKCTAPGEMILAEYQIAEDEAVEWVASDFAGDAPSSVSSWAQASGMTPQQAADDIVTSAVAFKNRINAIRQIRMAAKAAIDAATTQGEINEIVETAMNDFGGVI